MKKVLNHDSYLTGAGTINANNEWREVYVHEDGSMCLVVYDVLDTYDPEYGDDTMCDWDNPKKVLYIENFYSSEIEVFNYEFLEYGDKLMIEIDDTMLE